MDRSMLPGIIEAILFVCGEPVGIEGLAHALDLTVSELEPVIEQMRDTYDLEKRGLRLNRFGGGIQLSTQPEFSPYIERLLRPATRQSLTQTVLETLSIIAYRQPVSKAEIESVRGVKCDYSVQLLTNRGLICEVGRRETLGRPILYGTTDAFLRHFGIEALDQLPQPELGPEAETISLFENQPEEETE